MEVLYEGSGENIKISSRKDNFISIGFYSGLAIKAVNALVEFTAGFLMIFLNHDSLTTIISFIAIPELEEDPTDFIMNHFIALGQNLSISTQHSVAIYMLLHGATKLAVIWLLWRKKMWSYPLALAIFGLIITFEIFSFARSHSALMLIILIIDAMIIFMILLEYKQLKKKKDSGSLPSRFHIWG